MNQTPNYALNQWEASDQLRRVDVNADNAKIDAALKAEANTRASAVSAINATLSGMVRLKAGHYTGDGAASRTISVGFTPKAVLLMSTDGEAGTGHATGTHTIGGLAVTGSPLLFNWGGEIQNAMEIVSGGFKVAYKYINSDYSVNTNVTNASYNYLAIG